jgi:hypothetical protein
LLFRDDLKYSYIKVGCQHAGSYKSSGKGLRPSQKSVKSDCEARIVVVATPDGNRLVVRDINSDHNHDLSRDTFAHSHQQRKLTTDDFESAAMMLNIGGNVTKVKEQLMGMTGKVRNCTAASKPRKTSRLSSHGNPNRFLAGLKPGFRG